MIDIFVSIINFICLLCSTVQPPPLGIDQPTSCVTVCVCVRNYATQTELTLFILNVPKLLFIFVKVFYSFWALTHFLFMAERLRKRPTIEYLLWLICKTTWQFNNQLKHSHFAAFPLTCCKFASKISIKVNCKLHLVCVSLTVCVCVCVYCLECGTNN